MPEAPNASVPDGILKSIQMLAQERRPLNLTAVKRHSPSLVAEVYGLSPFVGWRRALELAGVNVQEIAVELLDTCRCLICGEQRAILTSHLQSVHQMAADEYLRQFSDGFVTLETVRAKKMQPGKHFPHWEPIWSREYVLDRLAHYRLQGYPLNYAWHAANERALASAALAFCGSWDEALRAIGVDPAAARVSAVAVSLSRNDIIEQLQKRRRAKQALSTTAVMREDLRLMNAARRRFGSYENALRAAGIKPSEVLERPAYYTVIDKKLLLQEVRRIAQLKGKERHKAAQILHREFEGLVQSCYGSWGSVAETAGVPVERLLEYRFPNREAVLEWLADYTREGNPLKGGTLVRKDKGLYNAVCRHFGSFAKVIEHLRAVGMYSLAPRPGGLSERERRRYGELA